jgi:tetratricopeptide (TPR) repeat protein/DNA-binding CsgD family transcriptional regulator
MSDSIEELERMLASASRRADQIDLRVRLSAALLTSDSRAALEHAERAVGIARERKADDELARALIQVGACHLALAELDIALESFRAAVEHATRAEEPLLLLEAHFGVGRAHNGLGERARAIRSLKVALDLAVAAGDRPAEAKVANALAGIALARGEFIDALELCQRCLAIREELGDRHAIVRATNNIGVIHLELGDLESAREYFQRCEQLALPLADPNIDVTTYDNLGAVLQRMHRYDESRAHFERALELGRRLDAPSVVASALSGIGIALNASGKHREALVVLEEGLAVAEAIGHPATYSILANIGEARAGLGELDAAIPLLERALEGAKTAGLRVMEAQLLGQLSDICERAGQTERALELHKKASELHDAMSGPEQQRRIVELEMRAAIERAERERELMRRRTAELAGEVRSRTEELGSKALNLVEKEELLDSVRREIAGVAGDLDGGDAPRVNRIVERLESTSETADTFEASYEKIHQGFMRSLAERHPALTPTELKVCALLKADMATKEIAAVLSSSVRTVETHRLRIRKKLSLPPDTSMASYLASL